MPRQPRILMCPPDYFAIDYEINPWMHKEADADRSVAHAQWLEYRRLLESLGAEIEMVPPQIGLPDLVFTANAGLVHHNTFFSSRFRHEVRAKETPFFDATMAALGFDVVTLPKGLFFEGAGDALFCGGVLFAGYCTRSDVRAHRWLADRIGVRCITLELVDPRFYHIDTCFCPLNSTTAIWFPAAFDRYGQLAIRAAVPTLIEASEADACRFGCNSVALGSNIISPAGCDQLSTDLTKYGFTLSATDLTEFLKAGGSCKCLTLRLDGEQAAAWAA